MSTFIGNIEARLDDKGRIVIPSSYRKILSESDQKRVVMRRDSDNACLVFYPEEVWNKKVAELSNALDEWNPDDQMLLMQFVSDAEFLDVDGQGRVLLARRNLQSINAGQDVLFVGMMDRFAIWEPNTFAMHRIEQKELAQKIREKIKEAKGSKD